MKVIHLGVGRKCIVSAVEENGFCQVLDFLIRGSEDQPGLTGMMMALIFEQVPKEGPPMDNPRLVKRLYRDLLWEFKSDLTSGRVHTGMRIAFFFDSGEPQRIVCTNAFYKSRSTPPAEIQRALARRRDYFSAQALGLMESEKLEDGDDRVN